MPAAALASGATRPWVVVYGWVIVVRVSPRLPVIEHSFVLSITRHAAARMASGLSPFNSNDTIAPPPLCWRWAISYCGCDFSAGWNTRFTAGCDSRNSAIANALCE